MLYQGKFEFPYVRTGEPSDAQTKCVGPEPLLRHTKTCNWVPVADDEGHDEFRWVVLRQGVDFVRHHELVQNIAMHGQKWPRGL